MEQFSALNLLVMTLFDKLLDKHLLQKKINKK